jgi:hypothetical protein
LARLISLGLELGSDLAHSDILARSGEEEGAFERREFGHALILGACRLGAILVNGG